MAEEQQEAGIEVSEVTSTVAIEGNVCDESKCVSSSVGGVLNNYSDGVVRYDCKVFHLTGIDKDINDEDGILCAEGYVGQLTVENQVEGRLAENDDEDDNDGNHQDYYTCCPVVYNGSAGPRRCDDPEQVLPQPQESVASETFDPMPCFDEIRKYPRLMTKSAFYPDTYVCCDTLLKVNNSSSDVILSDPKNGSCCFESMCISQVKLFLLTHETSVRGGNFIPDSYCWAEGDQLFPFQCDGGYEGVKVETEYPIFADLEHHGSRLLYYYTCCPPDYLNRTADCDLITTEDNQLEIASQQTIQRHCSDPIQYEEGFGNMSCDGQHDILQHPIERKDVKLSEDAVYKSYICCDSPLLDNEEKIETEIFQKFFKQQECHPCSVFNGELNLCVIDNTYGQLWAMVCNDTEWTNKKLIPSDTPDDLVRFECCKDNASLFYKNEPLIQDQSFKATVYTQIIFSSIALAFSLVLFLGLLVPMASEFLQRTFRQQQEQHRRHVLGRSASFSQQRTQQDYSCYDLYLVFLAFPDIILSIFILDLYGGYSNQKWNPIHGGYIVDSVLRAQRKPIDNAIILACSTANTYLNAIIAFEVFTLLNNSHRRRKYTPPGLFNVSMKALAVYVFSIFVLLLRYFLEEHIDLTAQVWIYFGVSTAIPMGFVLYVWAVIWYRGLIPSTRGKLRVLSLYFLRILLVFIFVWLPAMILLSLSRRSDEVVYKSYKPLYYSIALILCSLQPILSTCMACTKPNIKTAIFNFLTLPIRCCFRSKKDQDRNDQAPSKLEQDSGTRNTSEKRENDTSR